MKYDQLGKCFFWIEIGEFVHNFLTVNFKLLKTRLNIYHLLSKKLSSFNTSKYLEYMLFLGLIVSIYFNLFAFPWALYYKIEFKNLSKSFSQYVVVEVDKVTSIEFDDSKKYLVSSFCFSNSDSIVSIKTINHKSKTFFYHEIKYSEFLDSMKHNTVNSLNNEGDIIQFFNKNREIEFTAHLSDSLPNVYPKTIMMEDIKTLPVRIDFPNRVSSLKNVIESKDEINLVLLNIETKGYKLINLADLKKQLSEKSGYSFEEIENKIKSLKQ